MLQIVILLTILTATPELDARYYGQWLEEIAVLATAEEQRLFTSLGSDVEREAFVRRFWAARDLGPAVPGNTAREVWDHHHQLAAERIGDRDDPRFETLRLLGEPSHLYRIECLFFGDKYLLRPIEIWRYSPQDAGGPESPEDLLALFIREDSEKATTRIWSRHEEPADLVAERPRPWRWRGSMRKSLELLYKWEGDRKVAFTLCVDRNPEPFAALDEAVAAARTPEEIRALAKLPAVEWTEGFAPTTAEIRALPGDVEIRFPGLRGGQPVLEARIRLDRQALLGEREEGHFELRSEIVRQGEIRDRASWSLVLSADATETSIPVGFFRSAEPESTHLLLRLADPEAGRHYLSVQPLEPPAIGWTLPVGHPVPAGYHLLGAGGFELVLGAHHLEILDLEPGPKIRRLEVRAAARGPRIAAVEWRLEGEIVATSHRAPYTAVIELGRLPIRRRLEAVAVDRHGAPLARDRVLLNGGPHRLAVRLVEPQPGESYRGPVSVRAVVDRPAGSVLQGVEIFVNDRSLGRRSEEPFEIATELGDGLAMIRAVATLGDGRSAEDVVIVNASDFVEEVDVDLVELYVSVRDGQGRPVHDLEASDFEVREEGVAQNLERFERIENLPIHVLLAVDASESMRRRMHRARKVADEFLRGVVSPKDQASLLAFNHLPQMLSGFTHDGDLLAEQAADLEAAGGTALYDSLVYALFQFGGLKGKRALVLVSDGADEHSRFEVEEAVEFAKRVGVSIYPIGVGLSPDLVRRNLGGMNLRLRPYVKLLRELAEDTGGLVLFVDTDKDLARALDQIEEDLRSQYLLAYASPASERRGFREVEVEVLRAGLEARTIRGYFAD